MMSSTFLQALRALVVLAGAGTAAGAWAQSGTAVARSAGVQMALTDVAISVAPLSMNTAGVFHTETPVPGWSVAEIDATDPLADSLRASHYNLLASDLASVTGYAHDGVTRTASATASLDSAWNADHVGIAVDDVDDARWFSASVGESSGMHIELSAYSALTLQGRIVTTAQLATASAHALTGGVQMWAQLQNDTTFETQSLMRDYPFDPNYAALDEPFTFTLVNAGPDTVSYSWSAGQSAWLQWGVPGALPAVPEPSSLPLMAAGLAVVLGAARMRRGLDAKYPAPVSPSAVTGP